MKSFIICCLGILLCSFALAEPLLDNSLQNQAMSEISALSVLPADNTAFETQSGFIVSIANVQDFQEFVRVQTLLQSLAAVQKLQVQKITPDTLELLVESNDFSNLENQLAQLNSFNNMSASNQHIALAYKEVA